ncbi:MAG: endonuclease, partial [Salinivirgaceae bacterium]|nr:endonuclease [Salinivirgaceae bacterium]
MKNLYLLVAILLINLVTYGQGVPVDYYDGISGTGYTLKTNLCNLIDGHSQQTYDALWTHFQTTDVDSHYENDGSVLDMYSENPDGADPYNFTYTSDQCGTYGIEGDCYNREHSFPKSWFDDGYPMYSDLFHLYPTDGKVNGYRGNYPFGETSSPTTTSDNGCKLGPSSYSGYTGTVFEPIDEFKGDFARSYFYMATRYEDVISGWSGSDMLDGSSDKVFTTWALNMLIEWHLGDPVSQKEIDRNDAVYDIQGNANPFIDNPSYVTAIWTTDPTLMVSSTSLSGYSYEVGSGPSTSQNFNLSGINLDGSQVTVSAPTNYEVSTDNSSFSASVNVNYSAPTLSSTMIYVRLKAGLSIASYNGENVTCNDNGTASDVIVSNSGSVTATSLFCDDFEDNLNDWIVTNDADPDAFIEIINTFGGANSSTNAALFTTPNPGATTYYTSSIEKTFLNSQNLSVNFWYFFEDYRGGEINIYINGTKFYGIATEGGGDIAISDTDDDIWTEILLDLSGSTSTLDDYTIKIEGISKSASTWQDRVAIDELCVYGTTVSGPSLSVSTSSLTGYTYVEGAGASTAQSFTISGSDLDGTEVTVTAPTNYEVSLDDATFAATRTISYTAPTLNATTVYVRLKAGLSVGTFNGETISIAGGGDSDGASVTCSGEVTAVPDPEPDNQPADFAATANGSSQIDLGWTDASAGQIPAGYLILANEAGTFTAPSDGTDPAEDTDLSDGSAVVKVAHGSGASHSFTGLSASTQYYFTIYSYTNSASDINFKTDAPPTANA